MTSTIQSVVRYERGASYAAIVGLSIMAALNWRAPASVEAKASTEFWRPLQIVGAEVEHYETLNEMASASTAVVRGRLVDFALSRQLRGDAPEDVVSYGVATLQIDDAVRGEKLGTSVPVEFLLPDVASPIAEVITAMRRTMPKEDLLLFLRRKRGKNETQFFRLVNSKGLWSQVDQRVITPLARPHNDVDWRNAFHDDGAGEVRYQSELAGVRSLTELANRMRR